jgi:hypothetical protein
LSGSYGFTFTSLFTGPISNPLLGVGVLTFDSAGNLSGNETVVLQDPSQNAKDVQAFPVPFTGTYTVNADGTGTMKLTLQIPNTRPTSISFVITDGGSNVYFVNTGGDNFLSNGTARKQ